jgi:hypothetical protein
MRVNWKQGTILFMDFFPLQDFIIDHVYNIGPLINFLLHWRMHPYRDPIFFYYRLFLGSIPLLIFFLEISNDGVLYVFYAVSFNFGWKMKF